MTLTEKSVIKRGSPSALAREAAQTTRAYELGCATGLFRAPRVLGCDTASGCLELERLDDITPMQRLLAYASSGSSVWDRLGQVLAAIHGAPAAKDASGHAMSERLPPDWRLAGAAEVPIHGDFDAGNIFYQQPSDTIVVLDWAVTPMFDGVGDVGPRCFDASFFVSGAFFLARRLLWHRAIEEKLRRFLRAYERASGAALDRVALADFALRAGQLRLQRQPKSAWQLASYKRSLKRLCRFLEHRLDY